MKDLKIYKDFNNDDIKNKIFIIDSSASFIPTLVNSIDNINFYLADKFTAIFCSHRIDGVFKNITLEELKLKIKKGEMFVGGGSILEEAINYINDNNLKGDVLIFSDGYFELDISKLKNNLAILSTEMRPIIKGEYKSFMNDLESFEHFYRPRDITEENYKLKKVAQQYNL